MVKSGFEEKLFVCPLVQLEFWGSSETTQGFWILGLLDLRVVEWSFYLVTITLNEKQEAVSTCLLSWILHETYPNSGLPVFTFFGGIEGYFPGYLFTLLCPLGFTYVYRHDIFWHHNTAIAFFF